MNREQILVVLPALLGAPVTIAWALSLADVARRRDLDPGRKVLYATILVIVVPATLLYLLSRPTSVVRLRQRPGLSRAPADWRNDLLRRLEQRPGGPPVLGPSEEREMRTRVLALMTPVVEG